MWYNWCDPSHLSIGTRIAAVHKRIAREWWQATKPVASGLISLRITEAQKLDRAANSLHKYICTEVYHFGIAFGQRQFWKSSVQVVEGSDIYSNPGSLGEVNVASCRPFEVETQEVRVESDYLRQSVLLINCDRDIKCDTLFRVLAHWSFF